MKFLKSLTPIKKEKLLYKCILKKKIQDRHLSNTVISKSLNLLEALLIIKLMKSMIHMV